MALRHYNFCAGPAALPTDVLERSATGNVRLARSWLVGDGN